MEDYIMLSFNVLENNQKPLYKKCIDEENEEYEGAFCPYCGQQMYFMECYLKTPITNPNYNSEDFDSSPTLAFTAVWECIQVKEEGYNGCGAKFSMDDKEIGYYEYIGNKKYETTSCSSVLYPELNEVRR
jgi:hypothetical protein